MPLMRDAAELLGRLEELRAILRKKHHYIRGEARTLLDFTSDSIAIRQLANNILQALAAIDTAEKEIDDLIREELRPKLERRDRRTPKEPNNMERRLAELERKVEELSRPKNVTDLRQRKEGGAK